jgi:hypothetical protein
MKNVNLEEWLPIALAVVVLTSIPVFVIVSAHMESRTFNRLTGAHTTWADALFVELRVQEAPQ